ncbi:MAG: hypothetical protein WDW36_008012 [Sanguina aurantia]
MPAVADNMTDLLGAGQNLPVWLAPAFNVQDFDADTCVADLRRYVPLSTLQTELNSYLSLLKTKLVEVINEDYSDYVGLAGKLTGVEGAVLRMRRPLGELKDKLTVVQEAVRSELAALHQGLKRRKEVATARSLLELLQEVAHVASKVDKLLAEVAASDPSVPAATASHHSSDTYTASLTAAHPSSTPTPTPTPFITPNGGPEAVTDGGDLDAYARLLERVAGEVSRLAFLCARGKDLAFVKTLEPRVASSRADLSSRLHTALVAALTQQRHPATLHCLHACVELGCGEVAEGCVRTVVVAPLLQGCIAAHRKAHPRSGAREDELSSLLTQVLAAVHAALAPVLAAALSPHSALRSLDLLGAALLQEVQAALAASLPGVFSPGIPPAFHANYLASLHFLESLEAMCHSRGSVDRLRASPAHAAFLRRWNLSVYFSLLYQEIAGELEEQTGVPRFHPAALPAPTSFPSAAPGGGEGGGGGAGGGGGPEAARDGRNVTATTATGISPHLSITHTLLLCLQRAVSCEVFLPSLGDRFFRLVLQLVQRYATWAAAAVTARSGAGPDPVLVWVGQADSNAQTPVLLQTHMVKLAALMAVAVAVEGGHAMSWVAAASLEELSMLLHDCEAVAGVLASWLLPALQPLLGPVVPPPCAGSHGPPQHLCVWHLPFPPIRHTRAHTHSPETASSSSLRVQSAALLDILSSEVGEQCCAVVKALKAIAATYRMTTKGPPVRHSHYASGVLAPLATLLASPQEQCEVLKAPGMQPACASVGRGAAGHAASSTTGGRGEHIAALDRGRGRAGGDGSAGGMVTLVRAPLFVPADRPERFGKAAASGADAVILDLEDAVAPAAKAAARAALRCDFTTLPVILRINAAGTAWHADDLAAATSLHPPLRRRFACAVQRLQPGAIASLTLRVVRVVNGRYRQLSEELLSTVRKTESSLKRLKKSRPGEGAEGAMADSDKIALQLHLDVQEYGRQITGLGLDPMHLASYKQLIDAVAITSPATAQPMSKS